MKKLKYILSVSLAMMAGGIIAQNTTPTADQLSLQKAIETAMVNNYDLKIAGNSLKKAENNNTAGNAGLLPSVSINGGTEYSNNDSEMQLNGTGNDAVVTTDGAESMSYNASARVDYTLFDGFGNVYTRKKLKQANMLQETLYRQQMEMTILQVVQYYYEACRAQQNLTLAQESMRISRDRYTRAKDQKTYGQANQLDLLNAEVDMNSDSTAILQAEQALLMGIKNLNVVMGTAISNTYSFDDQVTFLDDLTAESVMTETMLNNSSLLSQQQQQGISRMDLKITQAAKYPTLSAYGQYGYNRQDNDAGQLAYNQNLGTTAGVSLKFNVFNGRQQRTREQNAKLDLRSQLERTFQIQSELERDAANAYTDYDYKRRIADLQQSSLKQAKLNFDQTKEMFQLGRVTSIEFRTAQQNLLNVANKYNDALFQAKVAEYNLLQLTGTLIKG
ncbi:MAG: TolC family protein [Marinilabiliaceae bacterium]|nr:TolC family protein [Marinilabiliaceae bacterium]